MPYQAAQGVRWLFWFARRICVIKQDDEHEKNQLATENTEFTEGMEFARMCNSLPDSQKRLVAVNIDFAHRVPRKNMWNPLHLCVCALCGLNCGF